MDKKKTILGYLSEIFKLYGITILLLNIFCMFFGDKAQGASTIYVFGSKGLANSTMLEFFLIITLLIVLRVLFYTDMVIKKASLVTRTILMFSCSLAISVGFVFIFDWFPVTDVQAWVMFGLGFVVGCAISTCIVALAEKQENKLLEDALKRLKEAQ